MVLVNPDAQEFACDRPRNNPAACWATCWGIEPKRIIVQLAIMTHSLSAQPILSLAQAGIDVLSGPPPPFAHEVVLRRGDAILLPDMYWHAVENLEPTIAVGLNEQPACTGARFSTLRPTVRRWQ